MSQTMENSYSLPAQMRKDNSIGSARRRKEHGKTNLDRAHDAELEIQHRIVPIASARRRKGRPRGMEGFMRNEHNIDITGDGNVSSWEANASHELENVEGRDLYGDGQVSEEEIRMTRVIEGRKMWCKAFISTHIETIQEFHPLFAKKAPKEILDLMLDDHDDFGGFPVMCAELEAKSRLMMRNSSFKMQQCMTWKEPYTPGPETARILHETRLARVYAEPRPTIGLKARGSIPEYHNFSNYAKYLSIHEGHSV